MRKSTTPKHTSTRAKNAIGKSRIQRLRDDKESLDKFFRNLTDNGRFRDESYEYLRKDLHELQKEGVDLKLLESVLRSAAYMPDEKVPLGPWHDIRWVENLSKRLRAIAEDLDRVLQGGELFLTPINAAMAFEIKDPVSASVGASVTWNYQHVLKSKTPENIRDTPGQIRAFADYLEGARSLQKFVSHRSLRSMALLSLIELVTTRKNKPNVAILERLLNAVFDAIGQESQYTASWLNTFYGRNNLSAKLESAKKRLARRRS